MSLSKACILGRMKAGARLMAMNSLDGPRCPYWEGTHEFPHARSFASLVQHGQLRWKTPGAAPAFGRYGEIEVVPESEK